MLSVTTGLPFVGMKELCRASLISVFSTDDVPLTNQAKITQNQMVPGSEWSSKKFLLQIHSQPYTVF